MHLHCDVMCLIVFLCRVWVGYHLLPHLQLNQLQMLSKLVQKSSNPRFGSSFTQCCNYSDISYFHFVKAYFETRLDVRLRKKS